MDENIPEPLAVARSRIEAKRAETEIRFADEVRRATPEDYEVILRCYVLDRVVYFVEETYNAWIKVNLPVAKLRETIEAEMAKIINEAFDTKHRLRYTPDHPFARVSAKDLFRQAVENVIRTSDEWKQIQGALKELAEWQADNHRPRLKELRAEATWTQETLARKAGVDVSVVKRAETGRATLSTESRSNIAEALSKELGREIQVTDL
jgi:DNA-binding XRE family transcriptional regulator